MAISPLIDICVTQKNINITQASLTYNESSPRVQGNASNVPLDNRNTVGTKTGSVQSNNTCLSIPDVSIETQCSNVTSGTTGDDEDDNSTTSSMRSEENPNERHTLFLSSPTAPDKNDDWGDTMETKQQNSIRIYYQNINGLKHNGSWDK